MKRQILSICSAIFVLAACNSENKPEEKTASATDTSNSATTREEAWIPVDDSTSWKNMEAYATPGPMHQLLASWNGTWKGETTMWEHEGAQPAKSQGTAVNTMIMGGKYQSSKHSGNMMGQPFEGASLTAFDNATKQFTSTWIDNWGTGIMIMTGTWDDAAKTMTLTGKTPDINRPGKQCSYRQLLKVIDDNTHVMEMYGPDQKTGKEFKMMEITMKRAK